MFWPAGTLSTDLQAIIRKKPFSLPIRTEFFEGLAIALVPAWSAKAERKIATGPGLAMGVVMTVAELPIKIDSEKIAAFCQEKGIRRLSLFGSVLRDDFDPARSDVDVLAEFETDALGGIGFRYFGYGEELSAILGRKVDFCSRLNSYIEPNVRREALVIYEQP